MDARPGHRRGRPPLSRAWNDELLAVLAALTTRRRESFIEQREKELDIKKRKDLAAAIASMDINYALLWDDKDFTRLLRNEGRKPTRREILEMADLLECDQDEANVLLRAVDYEPTQRPLKGAALAEALRPLSALLPTIQYPAFIMSREYNLLGANDQCLQVWGLSPEQFRDLQSKGEAHMLWQIFDAENGLVYPRVNTSREKNDNAEYQRFLKGMIRSFKVANVLAEQERWFAAVYQKLERLPAFAKLWAEVSVRDQPDPLQNGERIVRFVIGGQKHDVRVYRLTVAGTDNEFPQIVIYLPTGDTRGIFT